MPLQLPPQGGLDSLTPDRETSAGTAEVPSRTGIPCRHIQRVGFFANSKEPKELNCFEVVLFENSQCKTRSLKRTTKGKQDCGNRWPEAASYCRRLSSVRDIFFALAPFPGTLTLAALAGMGSCCCWAGPAPLAPCRGTPGAAAAAASFPFCSPTAASVGVDDLNRNASTTRARSRCIVAARSASASTAATAMSLLFPRKACSADGLTVEEGPSFFASGDTSDEATTRCAVDGPVDAPQACFPHWGVTTAGGLLGAPALLWRRATAALPWPHDPPGDLAGGAGEAAPVEVPPLLLLL